MELDYWLWWFFWLGGLVDVLFYGVFSYVLFDDLRNILWLLVHYTRLGMRILGGGRTYLLEGIRIMLNSVLLVDTLVKGNFLHQLFMLLTEPIQLFHVTINIARTFFLHLLQVLDIEFNQLLSLVLPPAPLYSYGHFLLHTGILDGLLLRVLHPDQLPQIGYGGRSLYADMLLVEGDGVGEYLPFILLLSFY